MSCMARHSILVGLTAGTILVSALLDRHAVRAADGPASDVQAATLEIQGLVDATRYLDAEAAAQRWLERMEAAHGPHSLEVARVIDLYAKAARTAATPPRPELVALAQRAVRVKEKAFGPDHVEVADSLSGLASMQGKNGDRASAEATFRRAIAIRERVSGKSGTALADNLNQLSVVLAATGRYDDAIASVSRALDALGPPESAPKLASHTYARLSKLLFQRGDMAGARAAAERNLAFVERALAGDAAEEAEAYHLLATVESAQSDFTAAQRHYERAIAIGSQDLRLDGPDVARFLTNLSINYWWQGEYGAARTTVERAIALAEKVQGPLAESTLSARAWLATLLVEDHRLDEAAALLEEILEAHSKSRSSSGTLEWELLHQLGAVELNRGRLAQARRAFERALESAVAAYGSDSKNVGMIENALGYVNCRTGDAFRARSLFDKGIAKLDAGYGRESNPAAIARANAASGLLEASDFAGAAALGEQAVEVFEKIQGPDHVDLADVLDVLAEAYYRLGDVVRARTVERRAVGIMERANGPRDPTLAHFLENLAELEMNAGETTVALAHATRALEIRVSVEGPTASVRNTLAILRWLGGRPQDAFDVALRSEADWRDVFQAVARGLSEREALHVRGSGTRVPPRDVALTVVGTTPTLARGEAARRAWDAVVRSRALVLDESASRHLATTHDAPPAVREIEERLAKARRRAAQIMTTDGPGEQSREARREAERIERELAAISPAEKMDAERRRAGLDAVAAALPTDTAIVSYVKYQRYVPTPGHRGKPPYRLEASYLAFVGSRDLGTVRAIPLGNAAPIDAAEAAWRLAVETPPPTLPGATAGDADAAYRAAAERLRALAWDPVVPALRSAKTVFIVPDDRLALVSFATLPSGDGYLLESGPTFHYLSSERDVLRLAPAASSARGLLAIGGPDFDATVGAQQAPGRDVYRGPVAACGSLQKLSFEPLPGAAIEAEEIAKLWRGARIDEPVVIWTGGQASETELKRNSSRYSAIHLATHGFFTPNDCGQGESGGGAEVEPAIDPLLSSGVALAGANKRHEVAAESDRDDGMLTAEEVASIDLSHAEWVVLSTCGSGLGKVTDGEGVIGLRRAFQVAGAGTLVMSLWNVRDVETREFMLGLYAARLAGSSTADAMRSAALEVLAFKRKTGRATHPHDWGAFVAAGAWR